ncbi:MAG TPA: NUDIX domain-containing protein [Candidatus Saccharimonadales bacterium]
MTGEYVAPILTVDSVIFQITDGQLMVLLINRAAEPFKGSWALPGGYNAAGETTTEALSRVVKAKSGIEVAKLKLVEQLYTFDTVARDPRGHAVSVTYMGLGLNLEPKDSKTTQSPQFFPVKQLPELAYDHHNIISYAHDRLASKITYTNAVYALLPELFTLPQLQATYEAIFGRQLDKRNFRKKYLSFDLIKPTKQFVKLGAHRPAQLYEFNQKELTSLSRSFD